MLSKFYFLVSCSDYYFHLPSALANDSSVCHWQIRYLVDLVQELLIISFHVASYMNWPRSNCIKASRVVISGVPLTTPMRKNKDENRGLSPGGSGFVRYKYWPTISWHKLQGKWMTYWSMHIHCKEHSSMQVPVWCSPSRHWLVRDWYRSS